MYNNCPTLSAICQHLPNLPSLFLSQAYTIFSLHFENFGRAKKYSYISFKGTVPNRASDKT